jgi:hypothetical protein
MNQKTLASIEDLTGRVVGEVRAEAERVVRIAFLEQDQPRWQFIADKINPFTTKGQAFVGEDGVSRVITSQFGKEEFSTLASTIELLSEGHLSVQVRKL